MKVLMMPDYRHDNPYQTLLAKALKVEHVQTIFPAGYKRVFPIFRQAQKHQVSLIHLHWPDPYFKGGSLSIKLIYGIKLICDVICCRLSGKRIVWTIHNLVSHDSRFCSIEQNSYILLAALSSALIVHSLFAATEVQKMYKANIKKMFVIPHGHYREVYGQTMAKNVAREKLNLPMHANIFLNFGMVKPYKGLEELIKIWKENDFGLLLIAGQAMNENYKVYIGDLINNHPEIIWFNQFVPEDEVHFYFSSADVVILPFRSVLTSGSLMLAFSFGKPVIAPSIGIAKEIFENVDELLYDPGNTQGLARSIKKSCSVDLLGLSKGIAERIDIFNWNEIGKKTAEVYQSVLK